MRVNWTESKLDGKRSNFKTRFSSPSSTHVIRITNLFHSYHIIIFRNKINEYSVKGTKRYEEILRFICNRLMNKCTKKFMKTADQIMNVIYIKMSKYSMYILLRFKLRKIVSIKSYIFFRFDQNTVLESVQVQTQFRFNSFRFKKLENLKKKLLNTSSRTWRNIFWNEIRLIVHYYVRKTAFYLYITHKIAPKLSLVIKGIYKNIFFVYENKYRSTCALYNERNAILQVRIVLSEKNVIRPAQFIFPIIKWGKKNELFTTRKYI